MMNNRTKRLTKEFEAMRLSIENQSLREIQIIYLDEQTYESGTFAISGPIDSPYEGFWFIIVVEWNQYYPMGGAPKFKLQNKIWNPYVDFQSDQICLDILKDNFSPALTTQKVLLSIISLLGQYKIDSGQSGFANPEAASQMKNNYPYFYQHAKDICEKYSFNKSYIYTDQIRGLPQEHVIKAQGQNLEKMIKQDLQQKKLHKMQPRAPLWKQQGLLSALQQQQIFQFILFQQNTGAIGNQQQEFLSLLSNESNSNLQSPQTKENVCKKSTEKKEDQEK